MSAASARGMRRRSSLRWLPLAASTLLAATSCSLSSNGDADHERAIDAAATAPDGPRPSCPVLTKDGVCDPLLQKDVATLASGGLILPAAWFPLPHDAALVVGVRWSQQRLITVRSGAPSTWDGATELDVREASGGTGVAVGADRLLYFLGQTDAAAALHVAKVDEAGIGASELVALEGVYGTPRWPQAVGLPDGRTLLAFVTMDSRIVAGAAAPASPFVMREVPFPEVEPVGVLTHVGVTRDGAWVLSYQAADRAFRFHAGAVVSGDDGATWGPPIALPSAPAETLSDVFPIARLDRGVDLYYVRGAPGFERVRRRALHDDETLGPEQQVTADDVGRVEKPQPRRRPDGRIAMLFTLHHGIAGTLAIAVVDGDAPW